MSIATTTRKAGPFTGNGVTTVFPFSFKVFTAADLLVVRATGGVETTLILNSDYSVTLNSNQDTSPGGNVTMFVAPSSSFTITLTSAVAQTQPVVLTNNGGFYPTVINNALDRLTILIQQLAEGASRSLKLSLSSSTAVSTTLPTPVANKALGWNSTGDALTNIDVSSGGGGGAVSSVNGQTGDVTITAAGLGAITSVNGQTGPAVTLVTGVSSVNGSTGAVTVTPASISAVATTARGTANGVASLDSSGLVPTSQLPTSGSYKGTWNATTNTPTIVSGVGVNGDFYKVATAGSTTIDGVSSWAIGDEIRFGASTWQKIANSAAVSSVNGLTGAVTITATSLGAADTALSNVSRTVNKAGASGTVSTYATAQNPQTADGRKRIIAGRDFGLALNGSTDDAPALNDIIQKVGARGGGYIDIAADLTPGGSAYMKILSSINNNVPGVTVRGTHFPNWSEFRNDPLANPSGVTIVPGFDGNACYHFTPFNNTAPQITGGGFEYLSVLGAQTGSGSSQELLRVDGVSRGSYIMNLLNPAGPTCARFLGRDPDYISSISNTSIQYANVDLYCRAGFITGANKGAHGVITQTSETFTNAGRSGNISLNRDWRILFEGVNGKALWNRSTDANSGFVVIAGQAGYPGVNELLWTSTGAGGTTGTYSMSFSGGTAIAGQSIVAPTGTFTVAGGKITSYTFTTTGSGYEKTAAPPTVSFASCPGLTGASATCVIGVILYYADAAGKSKRSYLGGQSQGFDLLSGYLCPIILEGNNVPGVGTEYAIDNGAASGIFSAYIDTGNGTPQPTVGPQAFAKTRDAVYGIDYSAMSVGPVFAGSQYAAFLTRTARSVTSPFTATSYGTGIAAEFFMGGNTIDLRLEDDSTGVIRLRDPLGVLTKLSIWSSLQVTGGFELQPTIGGTYDPTANGRMTFEAVSNTQARIKLKGSDGVVRSGSLSLSSTGDVAASLSSAIPASVGAQTAGVATTASRSDHIHDHGNQTAGSHHAAATTSVAGFMSTTDKTKLDSLSTATATTTVNGLMSSTDKTKLDAVSSGAVLEASQSFAGATIVHGAIGAQGVVIPGATLGDYVLVGCSMPMQNCTISGIIPATNAVQVIFTNNTGAAVTLAAGTVYVRVLKR